MLNNILEIQIQQYSQWIIHHDYVEFILGKWVWHNIWKSINIIHDISR